MMVIETREAAKDKAFDLFDEVKELDHKKKLVLCELEDMLHELFEEDDDREGDEDTEIEYRRGRMYRRSSMRDHSDHEDDEMDRRPQYRRRMRMRRY